MTVTRVVPLPSAAWASSTVKTRRVGATSASAMATDAPVTAVPASVPPIVTVSDPSPATSSAEPARLNRPVPLVCPAGMVIVKSSTAV